MNNTWTWLHALLSLIVLSQPACRLSQSRPADDDGCSPGIEAPRDLAAPGTTLILGELHGTREDPAFTADVACLLLARGHQLVLALEIPATEQERIDRFLASSDGAAARTDLVASDYWTFPLQDGRRSQATVELLERARHWAHAGGARIEVVAFDAEVPPAERDAAMAEHLAAARRARPDAVFLVVTGSLHAMRTSTPDFEPMAARFEALVRPSPVRSLRLAHAGGSAWLCAAQCGPHELDGQRARGARSIKLFDRTTEGFDGEFYVGPLHASPPAVARDVSQR